MKDKVWRNVKTRENDLHGKVIYLLADCPNAIQQHITISQRQSACTFPSGILIMAYAPLGAKGTPWGSIGVMECETLNQIADAKGKTLAQVCLRWAYEQEVSFVVKSFSKERISENGDIFE